MSRYTLCVVQFCTMALLSCPLFDRSAPESVTYLLFECPRWNCYGRQLEVDILDFLELLKIEE